MSFLTPLYALGVLAVSLPVMLHLIRRMPKGEFAFSSLIFLSPSPPRLTRRSRLEHLLLLALRGLAIVLLALAFARPFFRAAASAEAAAGESQRTVIVVDSSASMRRGDLWRQTVAEVDTVLGAMGPTDEVAIFMCDESLRPLAGFDEMSKIAPSQRRGMIRERLAATGPTWAGTQLGRGLMDAVDVVNNVPEAKASHAVDKQRIVMVTDLQEGGRLDVLADYPWPDAVELDVRPLQPQHRGNAGIHRLADRAPSDTGGTARELRVRVSNDGASTADHFALRWLDPDGRPVGAPTPVFVPAGESRVVRVGRPRDPAPAERLQLTGDGCEFDNTLYLTTRPQTEQLVVYWGGDAADDPDGPRFYLERALSAGLSRPLELVTAGDGGRFELESPKTTPLVVVVDELETDRLAALREYVAAGGTALVVLRENQASAANLAVLLDVPTLDVVEADVDGYTMLGQIAFDHPLFAATSGPHFNNFTQIHFWMYRRMKAVQLGDATIVARFENGDPAVVEKPFGHGRVVVMASGWQPRESQLARSWKFVLLVSALVERSRTGDSEQVYFTVGEPVPLDNDHVTQRELVVVKPDGKSVVLGGDARQFAETDLPGLYRREAADGPQPFAVNLDPAESRTKPLPVQTLEQLGCRMVNRQTVAENDARRQLLDAQLESRQKLWQWLAVSALGILVVETWLAGRTTMRSAMRNP